MGRLNSEVIVKKFGGTSVATEEARKMCKKHVMDEMSRGKSVVVVVSAMGREGASYATDTLLGLADGLDARETDQLMHVGELVSAMVMKSELEKENKNGKGCHVKVAAGTDTGIETDSCHGEASIQRVDTGIMESWLQEGKVVIVPGFQGHDEHGRVTTLGRGGSDTTAVVLGASLQAERVDIYTDVEGVFSADPRQVTESEPLSRISYDDLMNMAEGGAKVVHPRAVSIGQKYRVPLRILSTFKSGNGSFVGPDKFSESIEQIAEGDMVQAVVSKGGLVSFRVYAPEGMLSVLEAITEAGISMDVIDVADTNGRFALDEHQAEKAVHVLKRLSEEEELMDFSKEVVAKVSLIGSGITGRPGVMYGAIQALSKDGISVKGSSDSKTTISLLVDSKQEAQAVVALHKKFIKLKKSGSA